MDFKQFKGKSLSELLKQYSEAIVTDDYYVAAAIEVYLTNTFTLTTDTLTEDAISEVLMKLDLTHYEKQQIVDVKKCAGKIREELNPFFVSSYDDIEKKITRLLNTARSMSSVRPIR